MKEKTNKDNTEGYFLLIQAQGYEKWIHSYTFQKERQKEKESGREIETNRGNEKHHLHHKYLNS